MAVVSAEVVLRGKGKVCDSVTCLVLIEQVSQCSQIMHFDSWILLFSLRNESVIYKGMDLGGCFMNLILWCGKGEGRGKAEPAGAMFAMPRLCYRVLHLL